MPDRPGLLVAGSIALDTVGGASTPIEDELGGSALYFALAASLIMPVGIAAPVGAADLERVRDVIGDRPIDVSHLKVFDAPTYRWRAQQHVDRNIDLGSQDSIYDLWDPEVPPRFDGWAFVGSVRPDRQVQLAERLSGARMLAADSMVSYIHARRDEAFQVVGRSHWYFCNQDEFAALDGHEPDEFRRRWSLVGLVLKLGPGGVTAFTDAGSVHVPAPLGRPVVDTTGGGDAVAAGMLARWLTTGARPGGLGDALVWGVACASLTIEDIGLRAIARATPAQLAERVDEVRELTRRA
ncbi:MAG TPA: PfkB family carbohydrate kinase [Patescibacteria group bacterium]|nr:PfkB family carbohydrate kinase [Patescibacteria group bacterium]